MPITAPEIITERGKRDAKRHRDKQRKAIKDQLPHIIAEESIITGKKGRIVKVPIKNLRIPEFTHKRGGSGAGVGQGKGGKGDVIGRRPIQGKGSEPGKPGQEPGVDYIETEIPLEELIEMMYEDLGLPRLEEKNVRKLIVELGWKFRGTTHSGPPALRDTKKTTAEAMKRFWAFLIALEQKTLRSRLDCFKALKRAKGIFPIALSLLLNPEETFPEEPLRKEDIKPFKIFTADGERFHKMEPKIAHKSQAVVISMRDISGSMTEDKRYLAIALLSWFIGVLNEIFEHVDTRFVVHHTLARLVDEYEFFHAGETGGTLCYTAYEIANALIESEYPRSQWNVYVWHFSDGEDFDPARTIVELKRLFGKDINMFGYGEIQPEGGYTGFTQLLQEFTKAFDLTDSSEENNLKVVASENDRYPFLAVVIKKKEHILPAIRAFLKRDRWQK